MKVAFLQNGKTRQKAVNEISAEYFKRLRRYVGVEEIIIPDLKKVQNLSPDEIKTEEGKKTLQQIGSRDCVVLLDENGQSLTSVKFSQKLQMLMNKGPKRIVFVVGGPYGFSPEMYQRANEVISLSPMTFSHQIIRAIFAEQLYRAFTIIHNEPYHNA